MCNLAVINATKQLYKGPRGGLYWLDEKGKKHYIKENSTSDRSDSSQQDDKDSLSERGKDEITCPFDKKNKILVSGLVCEECWFQEQLKLKGGQYL